MIAFMGYAVIAFWEFYHLKGSGYEGFTYAVSDPLDLTIIAACAAVGMLRVPVVQLQSGFNFHGRYRFVGAWRPVRCHVHRHAYGIPRDYSAGLFVMET